MLTTEQQGKIQPKLKTILVIHAALGIGMLSMAIVIAAIVDWKKLSSEAGMLPLMAAVTGLLTFGMSFIIPRLLAAQSTDIAASLTKQTGSNEVPAEEILKALIGNSMNNKIISAALVEGGVLLNLTVFMIDPTTVSLAIVAIGLLIFAFRFPFPGRQKSKLEIDLDDVRRELRLLQP
jgi:hypothetical protein